MLKNLSVSFKDLIGFILIIPVSSWAFLYCMYQTVNEWTVSNLRLNHINLNKHITCSNTDWTSSDGKFKQQPKHNTTQIYQLKAKNTPPPFSLITWFISEIPQSVLSEHHQPDLAAWLTRHYTFTAWSRLRARWLWHFNFWESSKQTTYTNNKTL